MEHAEEFERLTRQLDDYHELLVFGQVQRVVDDPEGWRREIRRQARRDNVRVSTVARGTSVAAIRIRGVTDGQMRLALRVMEANREAMDRASLLGHEVRGWIRVADGEAATRCSRCGARLYVRVEPPPLVLDGEVFEVACSSAEPA